MAYGSILGQMPPVPDMEASNISYDNATSQLTATNVQAAIDEIVQNTSGRISVNGTLKTGIAAEDITEGSFVVEGGPWSEVSILNDVVSSNYHPLGSYELSNNNFICFNYYTSDDSNREQLAYLIFNKQLEVIQEITLLNLGTAAYVNKINIAKINTDRFVVTFGENSSSTGTGRYYARIIDVNNNSITLGETIDLSRSFNDTNQYSYSYPYGLDNDCFIFINAVSTSGGFTVSVMKYMEDSTTIISSGAVAISGLIYQNNVNILNWGNNQFSIYIGSNNDYPNFPSFAYTINENSIAISQLAGQKLNLGYMVKAEHAIYVISSNLAIIFYLRTTETNPFKYRFIQYNTANGEATPLEENEILGRFFGLNQVDFYIADKIINNCIFFIDNNYFLSIKIDPSAQTLQYNLYDIEVIQFNNPNISHHPHYYNFANATTEGNYIATGNRNSRISGTFVYPDKMFISNSTDTISGISAESTSQGEIIDYYVPN